MEGEMEAWGREGDASNDSDWKVQFALKGYD
jgi:hypothetical protein